MIVFAPAVMPPSRVVAAGAPRPPNGGAPRQNSVGVVASIAYKPKFKASPALHVAVRWPPSKLPKVKAYRSGQFAPDDVDSLDSLGSHEALMKVSKQPPDMLSPQSAIVRSAKAKPTASSATAAATGSSSSGAAVALNGSSPVSSRRGSSSSMAHKGRPSPTTQQQRDPSPVASSANSHGTALVLGSSEPGPRQDPAGSADASMQLTDNSSTAALAADAGTADAGTAAPKESVAVRPNLRRQDSRMSRDNAQSFKRSKGRLALTSPSPSLAEAVPDGSVTVHFRFGVVEQKRGFGGVWPFGQSVRAVAHLVPRELQFEFLTGAWPKPPVEMHSPVVTEDEALKKLLASEEDIEHPSVEPHDGAMSSSISGSASFSIDDPRARDLSAELRRAIHKCGMPRVMDLFRRFDVDGSGKIDNKEFRKAMQALELAWPVEDMDLLYRSVDRDGSGSIEYKELNKLLRQGADVQLDAALKPGAVEIMKKQTSPKRTRNQAPSGPMKAVTIEGLRAALTANSTRVIDTFRILDKDGDGTITKAEFGAALPLLGFDASRTDLTDELFKMFDSDGGGTIRFDELNQKLRQGAAVELAAELKAGAVGAIELKARNKIAPGSSRRHLLGEQGSSIVIKKVTVAGVRKALAASYSRVIDFFKLMDKNGDGAVTKHEFRAGLGLLGIDESQASMEAIDALFDSFDMDGSGELTFNELKTILRYEAAKLETREEIGDDRGDW